MLRGRTGTRVALAALGALAAVLLPGAAAAGSGQAAAAKAAKPKLVTVNDFYFAPSSVKIRKGGTVKWVWSAANTYPHDVHLKRGPKGLKRKASYSTKTTAVTGAVFKKKFPTPGTYRFICTIHPTLMHLTVVVKR